MNASNQPPPGGGDPPAPDHERELRDLHRRGCYDELLERLIRLYLRRVQSVVAYWVRSEDDRADLTQEIFLNVYKGLRGFRRASRMETWICKIAYHRCMAYLVRKKTDPLRRKASSSAEEDSGRENDGLDRRLAAKSAEPARQERGVLEQQRNEALKSAISQLPKKMRRCVRLRIEQDLKYQEIADALQVSVQTVKAHLFHARPRLRELLGEGFWDDYLPDEE